MIIIDEVKLAKEWADVYKASQPPLWRQFQDSWKKKSYVDKAITIWVMTSWVLTLILTIVHSISLVLGSYNIAITTLTVVALCSMVLSVAALSRQNNSADAIAERIEGCKEIWEMFSGFLRERNLKEDYQIQGLESILLQYLERKQERFEKHWSLFQDVTICTVGSFGVTIIFTVFQSANAGITGEVVFLMALLVIGLAVLLFASLYLLRDMLESIPSSTKYLERFLRTMRFARCNGYLVKSEDDAKGI